MPEIITLANADDDDVLDIVPVLEKSFQVKFGKDAFWNVETVGDFIDVVYAAVDHPHHESCTSQAAFYKVRNAALSIGARNIHPDTLMHELFPLSTRRKKIKKLLRLLGIKARLLEAPAWVDICAIVGLVLSVAVLFFNWVAGLAGVAFFIAFVIVADKLGRNFTVHTIRELVEKISSENYLAMRNPRGTVNKNEIADAIIDLFVERLGIERKYITVESRFAWAREKTLDEV